MKTFPILLIVFVLIVCTAAGWPFRKHDLPPEHKMIEHAYFICDKCNSAEGGIYGKGPFKRFRSLTAPKCIHLWRGVSRAEFKQFAITVYHQDWHSEIRFWSQDN